MHGDPVGSGLAVPGGRGDSRGAERNRYLDLLRPMAIVGVVYGHWLLINLTYSGAATALVAGVFLIAVTGLLLLRALDLSPATQWGEPVGEPCPACGERNLREARVAVPESNGIVALCTAECGYAEVRPDPDGSPEPGGSPVSRLGTHKRGQRRRTRAEG